MGEYNQDGYFYHLSDDGTYLVNDANASDTSHTITTVTRNLIFGETKQYAYWLASRGDFVNTAIVYFGQGLVHKGNAFSYGTLFRSNGDSRDAAFSLRAVVSLRSDIPAVVE